MKIETNSELSVEGNLVDRGNAKFLDNQLNGKDIHFTSQKGLAYIEPPMGLSRMENEEFMDGTISKFYMSAHNAFSQHGAFSIRPEVIWYMIIHEIAILVKSDPVSYAKYFTNSPDKVVELKVIDNSLTLGDTNNNCWVKTIGLFNKPIKDNINEEVLNLFLPPFSTRTKESEAAILVSFMDTVSKYYQFRLLTLCGIPRVQIEGSVNDWGMMYNRVLNLAIYFPALTDYFIEVSKIIEKIRDTLANLELDLDFWKSIYKVNSESGGDTITGWLTAFNAFGVHPETHKFTMKTKFNWKEQFESGHGYLPNMFPSHVSTVPFIWEYLGKEIPMQFFAGILGIEYKNEFFTPSLGVGVAGN